MRVQPTEMSCQGRPSAYANTAICLHMSAYPLVPKQAELQLWPALQHPLQFNTHFFAVSQQRAGLVAKSYPLPFCF